MRERLKWPALCLVFLGILNLAFALGAIGFGWMLLAHPTEMHELMAEADLEPSEARWAEHFVRALFVGLPVIQLALAAFVIFAGVQMMNLRMRWAALAACFVVMLPCVSPCITCFVGFLVGGWALVHLMDVDVKQAFARGDGLGGGTGQPG